MQEINAEYDMLFRTLKNRHESKSGTENANNTTYNYNFDKVLREMLEKVVNLDGINIEVCGSWLWLSGNTYTHKAVLKALGFRRAGNKKCGIGMVMIMPSTHVKPCQWILCAGNMAVRKYRHRNRCVLHRLY